MKTLVIGDIHGCYIEFWELLEKAAISTEDEIIALGDIVDRGPDSLAVLDFFRTHLNARSLIGNHERKHILSFKGKIKPALSQVITRQQIGEKAYPDAAAFMETFPLFLESSQALLLHAFFEPGIPLKKQKEIVLVGTLGGEKYLKDTYARQWYELYEGDKPLIVGHHDYTGNGRPFIYNDKIFCINTGCCHGKTLTGIILPDFRIISVKSRKDYWRDLKKTSEGKMDGTS